MKQLLKVVLPVAAGAVLAGAVPSTFAQSTGFYLKADVGGNITQDVEVKQFFGANVGGAKLELDPGIRGGLGGGYQVTDFFAAEAEIGFFINEIDSVKGDGRVHDATLSNVPFMVNAKFQLPTGRCPFTPYIGAGIGVSETIFDVDYLRIGNVSLSGDDSDAVFAWQAFAGLRYALNDRMGLSLEYRYFEAGRPSWDADVTFGTFDNSFELGKTRTHSLSLAFDFRF